MKVLLQSISILKEKFDRLAEYFGEDSSVDVLLVVNDFAKAFEVVLGKFFSYLNFSREL